MPQNLSLDTQNLRVAFVSDDGETISQHFGRARYYEVLTIENAKVTKKERRDKAGHHTFHPQETEGGHQHHNEDPEHQLHKHNIMSANIADCDILIAGGMGNGAYMHLTEANIKPVVTSHKTISDAIDSILKGSIEDHTERLH